jgi:oligosaccharyl transferase complex subunit OST4
MISDDQLNLLAIFLGAFTMLLIVLYHFLEINSEDDGPILQQEKAAVVVSASSSDSRAALR